jgi:hypothetical protein
MNGIAIRSGRGSGGRRDGHDALGLEDFTLEMEFRL